MENNLTFLILAGSFISMAGTIAGAIFGVMMKKPSKKELSIITGFAGGIMLSVVVCDLIPEAINQWNVQGTVLFCILGSGLVLLADSKLNKYQNTQIKIANITALALMIHNFPEGIIMGCGFAAGTSLGIKMALIIGIHDVPEGIAVSAPLLSTGTGKFKIIIYAIITALPTMAGALAGGFVSNISLDVLGISLSIASGIMLYVVCFEMLPESLRLYSFKSSAVGILAGIAAGFIITNIL